MERVADLAVVIEANQHRLLTTRHAQQTAAAAPEPVVADEDESQMVDFQDEDGADEADALERDVRAPSSKPITELDADLDKQRQENARLEQKLLERQQRVQSKVEVTAFS